MPPWFKARFWIKCSIKASRHVIKHLAKAASPDAFKICLCKTKQQGRSIWADLCAHQRGKIENHFYKIRRKRLVFLTLLRNGDKL